LFLLAASVGVNLKGFDRFMGWFRISLVVVIALQYSTLSLFIKK
jgi:hypothetical protein